MSGIFNNQLRSVIEWVDADPDLLFERWTEAGDEIKNASKLIVGPGQGCIFVYEGRVEGVFTEEGLYDLKTDNIPFWTTVKNALYKFESFHKAGIWFFRKAGHLQYLQSVSKIYMAVGILKLYEQGRIVLDAPVTNYLPAKYSHYIKDASRVTVRMLLNHTSGIPEYNSDPAYVARLLQEPEHVFTADEYLGYIEHRSPDFEPGSQYAYTNTNYLILSLLADAVTGDHARFLGETIFRPLHLDHTFYRNDPGYLNYPNLVDSYWDKNGNGVVENVSPLQWNNVASQTGDDGIVTTPADAVKFLRGLMQGNLLSANTLAIMRSWVKDENGNFVYGLRLRYSTDFNGQVGLGHSGGGIGAGCELYYFPGKNLYVFIGMNLGTVIPSPIHETVSKIRDDIYRLLLE